MQIEHQLSPRLLERPVRVLIVGSGGNGSAMLMGLPYLHQAMRVWGHPGGLEVTVLDADIVSETNCVRQPFSQSDVGLNKAEVLVNRVNLFWGLDWTARPEFLEKGSLRNPDRAADVVIGCVDTRAARQTIETVVTASSPVIYWLDLGNNAASGQFVLGEPLNSLNRRRSDRLRTVSELYPEIVDRAAGKIPCQAVRRPRLWSIRNRSSTRRLQQALWPCCLAFSAMVAWITMGPSTTLRRGG